MSGQGRRLWRRLLLAGAAALVLLAGQQAALTHMIGHIADLGDATARTEARHGDDEHGMALSLSHICTTCLSLDTFTAPLPRPPGLALAASAFAVPLAPTFYPPPVTAVRHFRARAPPLLPA